MFYSFSLILKIVVGKPVCNIGGLKHVVYLSNIKRTVELDGNLAVYLLVIKCESKGRES